LSLGCMILYHPTVTAQTKSLLLRSVFTYELLEIEVLSEELSAGFFKHASKEKIWQTVMELESADICTVYGFGGTKEKALAQALKTIEPYGPGFPDRYLSV